MENKKLTRILYAEDEPDIRAIVQIILEDVGGFTVKYCETGGQVLRDIEEFKPDLVLLDVMMPEMDGPTTLQALQKMPAYAEIPIVFITAKVQPSEINQYRAMGVADVIIKPFDPMKLVDNLNAVWKKFSSGS